MLPAAWVVLDVLPRLPNGKLDRRALPAPQAEVAATYVAPRTPLESLLAELWCEVLGVARVGVHDHFFELGGHSLLAARLVSHVRRELQPRCSLATLFKSPTLEGFAGALERLAIAAAPVEAGAERGELLALQPLGSGPALFCICGVHLYAPLARLLGPDHPVYGVFLPYEHTLLASKPGAAPQLPSVEQMAADYVREIRRQQPTGPYHLLGVSFGGLLAYEVAQQLSAAGEAVGAVTVLDFDFDTGRPRRWSERLKRRLLALPRRWRAIMKPPAPLDAVADADPGALPPTDEEQRLFDLRDGIYEQAIAAYAPQPYGGRVHVVRAEETLATAGHQPAPDYGWERHVRDLRVEDVPGGHVSMLAEPHVHALAVCVRRQSRVAAMTTVSLSATLGDEPRRALRDRLLGAGAWTVIGTLGSHVMRLGGNLVVTRFLVPEMYGVMAIVLTVTMILHMLSDVGLHQMVVRHPRGHERAFLDTVWTVQVVRGALLWGVTTLIALGIYVAGAHGWLAPGSAYAAPELPAVLAVAGFSAVIFGFQSTKIDLAVRGLDLRRNVAIELAEQALGLAVMVALAWATGSVWSLVVGTLVGTLLYVVLSHVAIPGERNRFAWNREVLRQLAGFGKWLLLSSAVGVIAAHADRLLLAGHADARFLGLYAIAFALAGALGMVFERLFGQVLMPALCEVARDDPTQLPAACWRARLRADPVILFASGALFALGPLVIAVLYDDRYAGAGHVLSVLAVAMVFTRYRLLEQVYLVLDRPQYLAVLNAVSLVANFVLVPLGFVLGGTEGGLWAIALRGTTSLPFLFAFNARHGLNSLPREAALLAIWPLGWACGEALALLVR